MNDEAMVALIIMLASALTTGFVGISVGTRIIKRRGQRAWDRVPAEDKQRIYELMDRQVAHDRLMEEVKRAVRQAR